MTSSIHRPLFEAAAARTSVVVVGNIPVVVGIPEVGIPEVVLVDNMPTCVSMSLDSMAIKVATAAGFVLITVFLV